jgi:hypothetical protein
MTHTMKRRCRPNTLEASTEYVLVVEVSAGVKWTRAAIDASRLWLSRN